MIKKRLINLLADSKKYIYLSVLFKWLGLLSQVLIVYSFVTIFRFLFESINFNILKPLVFFAIGLFVRVLSDRMVVKLSFLSSSDVKKVLRNNIFDKLNALGTSYREKISSAEVVQMTTEGVEQLEIYFGQYLPQFFYSMIAPITLFIIVSRISLKVSLILLICVPLIPISIAMVQTFAKKLLGKYWKSYTSLGDTFLENLEGLTTLKVYSADEDMAKCMDEDAVNFRRITMRVLVMQLNSISIMDLVAIGGAAIGMVFAVKEFMVGNISVYGAFAIILLSAEFFIPMRQLGSFFHIAMNGMAASDKIFSLLDIPEDKIGDRCVSKESHDISVFDLNFSYDESRAILNDININIKRNSFVAFVGASGCGKSTLANILSGKLKNYSGTILIDDVNLNDVNKNSLKDILTTVTHNSYIFKGSVRDNLKMAGDFSDDEMMEAINKVNLNSLLCERDGLDTMILEGGSNLSGGERQRLALARAILKDSPIYIFDEATSNIDPESENIIMNVIYNLSKTKTILFISHKLSNIVDADKIYYMKDGRVEEEGNHEYLMSIDGDYANLYRHQVELEKYGSEVQDEN